MKLNNWHPVLTTAFYWVITRIYDSFALCIFVQIVLFSFSVAYLLSVLSELKIPHRLLKFVAIYISVSPAIGLNNICLIKDVPFCIVMIWQSVITIRIIESRGNWLKSFVHCVSFVIVLLMLSLIRHNGLFVVFSLLGCLAVLFRNYTKRVVGVAVSYLFLLLLIQGCVFSYFDVQQHSNTTGEMVGIPMSVMANNLVSDYDHTPNEVEDFLLSIAELDEWNERYIVGEWDSCKWEFGGIDLLKDTSLHKILILAWKSMCASPEAAYQSFRENTRVVWQVVGPVEWKTWVYIEDNDYGIIERSSDICRLVIETITAASLGIIGSVLFWNIGAVNLLAVILICTITKGNNRRLMAYLLPLLLYNLMTMLLLCGPSHRYFYFSSVLALPLLLLVLYRHNSTNAER